MSVREIGRKGDITGETRKLFSDPEVEALVIRGLAGRSRRKIIRHHLQAGGGTDFVSRNVSGVFLPRRLKEVRPAVTDWWDNLSQAQKGSASRISPYFSYAFSRAEAIGAHIDPGEEGPLTLSLRVDDNVSADRTFYVKRTASTRPTTSLATIFFEELSDLSKAVPLTDMTAIDQQPGDAILFVNHPYPTIHAVETPVAATQPVVATYTIS